jgi:Iap family predicted aminopeptidase
MIALWLACAAPDETVTLPDPLAEDALTAQTAAIVALGPRLVTTDAEVQAAALVENALLDVGIAAEREPFSWDAWLPGEATVTIDGTVWPAAALSPSPTTEGLVGVLADTDVDGQVALYSSDDGSRAEQFTDAFTGGAAAMVRVTEDLTEDGSLLVEVGHTLRGSSLPAIAVDREVGALLQAALGADVTIDIAAQVVEGHVSDNVVAIIEGTGSGWVAVTAHYDSWHPSESAADNALGVAMLLQLAERLAAERPESSVLFLVTSGEEQGLQGAFQWTLDNPELAGDIDRVINLDVPWASEGDPICGATDPGHAEAAADALLAEGIEATPRDGPAPASDHFPFQVLGADALWCTRVPYREYHTHADTLDQLNMTEAAAVLRAHWAILSDAVGLSPEAL